MSNTLVFLNALGWGITATAGVMLALLVGIVLRLIPICEAPVPFDMWRAPWRAQAQIAAGLGAGQRDAERDRLATPHDLSPASAGRRPARRGDAVGPPRGPTRPARPCARHVLARARHDRLHRAGGPVWTVRRAGPSTADVSDAIAWQPLSPPTVLGLPRRYRDNHHSVNRAAAGLPATVTGDRRSPSSPADSRRRRHLVCACRTA